MSKYILPDGYIDMKDEGNTYYGESAQILMRDVRKFYTEVKKLIKDVNYNDCLSSMLNILSNQNPELINKQEG